MKALDLLVEKRDDARRKALRNLARYKFSNFGYWAAIFVHLARETEKEGVQS